MERFTYRRLMFMFILCSTFFSTAWSQQSKAVKLPSTELGNIIGKFIASINSGNQDSIDQFTQLYLHKNLATVGTSSWNREHYAAMLKKLQEQSGVISPIDIRESPSPFYCAVIFQASKTRRIIGIEFNQHQNDSSLRTIELHPMASPSTPYRWSDKQMDYDGIAKAIDERVLFEVEKDEFSGTVLIAKDDTIFFKKSYGYSDRLNKIKNTNITRYHTGSIGKMITAVAIGQLVEQGKLSFEDTLGSILPDYPNKDAVSNVTIHQLLTHTSGIADPFELGKRIKGASYTTPLSNFPLFANAPLTMIPGDHHAYSNGNYAVLAAIVEKISGKSFEQYLRLQIFTPSGMNCAKARTYNKLARAVSYTHLPMVDPFGIEVRSPARDLKSEPEIEYSGFSNTYLTADDVYRFLLALRQGKLCSQKMVSQLTTGKVFIEQGKPIKYGYGFYDATMWGTTMRGHSGGGSNSGIGAEAEMVWDKNYYVIVLGNYDLEVVRPLTFSIVRFLGNQ